MLGAKQENKNSRNSVSNADTVDKFACTIDSDGYDPFATSGRPVTGEHDSSVTGGIGGGIAVYGAWTAANGAMLPNCIII